MSDDVFNDVQGSVDGASVTDMLRNEDYLDSISDTESDILDARTFLNHQQLGRARRRLKLSLIHI